jgi:hypothetical protein
MAWLGLNLTETEAEAEAVRRVLLVESRRQQEVLVLDFGVAYYIVRLRASRRPGQDKVLKNVCKGCAGLQQFL